MNTVDFITISGNACALVLTVLLLIGALAGDNLNSKINRCFLAMLVFCVPGSLIEMVYFFLEDVPGAGMAAFRSIIDFADYFFAAGLFTAFGMYLYAFISARSRAPGSISKTPFIVMCCVYCLNIPLVALYQLNQIFGFLGEAISAAMPNLVQAAAVIPAFSGGIAIVIALHNIKALGLAAKEWIPLLLYCIIPLPTLVLEFVSPRLWLGWFGSTVSMFLIYLHIQAEQGKKLKEQELAMAESRTAIMLSQIQPHMINNTLNTIYGLALRENSAETAAAIAEFSDYLHENLSSIGQSGPVPFSAELKHVQTYLSLEKRRFENLTVQYDIAETDFMLPSLALQPIVENAVRHGICQNGNAGTIIITTRRAANEIIITVRDDGAGFDAAAAPGDGLHIGIENVRSRLALLCGGRLEITSSPGAGATATLIIPINTAPPTQKGGPHG